MIVYDDDYDDDDVGDGDDMDPFQNTRYCPVSKYEIPIST